MKRLTYRDREGRAQWMPDLLEDDTGVSSALIRGKLADYEDDEEAKRSERDECHNHACRVRICPSWAPDECYCTGCQNRDSGDYPEGRK